MDSTIKRKISLRSANSCEEAEGEYCYCRCLGAFHGINHKKILDREEQLKVDGKPLDMCTCEQPELMPGVFIHEKTGVTFSVCKNCAGRVRLYYDPTNQPQNIRKVSYGVKIIKK